MGEPLCRRLRSSNLGNSHGVTPSRLAGFARLALEQFPPRRADISPRHLISVNALPISRLARERALANSAAPLRGRHLIILHFQRLTPSQRWPALYYPSIVIVVVSS